MKLELGRLTDRRPPFKYSMLARVSFSDTDAQGVVYYGRYLPYFDGARVEYLRHLELLLLEPTQEFVMRAVQVDYLAPARFDDLMEVFVRAARIGTTSASFEFAAYDLDRDILLVRARETLVRIDKQARRPVAIPEEYRRALLAFEGADCELPARA
jgi:acyl-CoA thioester hydrolase